MAQNYTGHTPSAGATPTGLAVDRPGYDPNTMTLEEWMTAQLDRDPNYRPPQGWNISEDGTVERVEPGFLMRHPWLIPLMGVAGGMGLSAAGVGGVTAAGSAGSGTAAGTTTGSAVANSPVGPLAGGYSLPTSGVPSALAPAGTPGGLLTKAGSFLKGQKVGDVLGGLGDVVGSATQAAGNNRIEADELNMRGNALYENQLMARSRDEQGQRDTALDNVYRDSWYGNRQASPYNSRGLTPINDQFKQSLSDLAGQGATKLSQSAQYDSNAIPALKPFERTKPGTLEKVGSWAGPILKGASIFGKVFGK